MPSIRLFRAIPEGPPYTGQGSWWAAACAHAERYRSMTGFGGPHLITATVTGRVLDLRPDFTRVLLASTGLDRADYDNGISDHDLLRDLVAVLAAEGYDWAVLNEGPDASYDEWLYLGIAPIEARQLDVADA